VWGIICPLTIQTQWNTSSWAIFGAWSELLAPLWFLPRQLPSYRTRRSYITITCVFAPVSFSQSEPMELTCSYLDGLPYLYCSHNHRTMPFPTPKQTWIYRGCIVRSNGKKYWGILFLKSTTHTRFYLSCCVRDYWTKLPYQFLKHCVYRNTVIVRVDCMIHVARYWSPRGEMWHLQMLKV
jgi:hypothetical protein